MNGIKIGYKTIAQVSEAVNDGKEIGFTLDSPYEVEKGKNPEGWYGIKKSFEFDGGANIIGKYGTGIIFSDSDDIKVYETLIEFINSETNSKWNYGDYDRVLLVVDLNDFE